MSDPIKQEFDKPEQAIEVINKSLHDLREGFSSGKQATDDEIVKLNAQIDAAESASAEFNKEYKLEKARAEQTEKRVEDLEKARFANGGAIVKMSAEKEAYFKMLMDGIGVGAGVVATQFAAQFPSQRTDVDNIGGFLVPEDMAASILREEKEISGLLALPTKRTFNKTFKQPIRTDLPLAARETELGTARTDTTKFRLESLTSKRLTVQVASSWEYLNWAIGNPEAEIANDVAMAFAIKKEFEMMRGNGVSQWQGILTDNRIQKIASNTANLIDFKDISTMIGEVKVYDGRSLSFITHRATTAFLRNLVGTDGHHLWQPAVSLSEAPTIWGIPVQIVGDVEVIDSGVVKEVSLMDRPDISASNFVTGSIPLLLGDFSGYLMGESITFLSNRDDSSAEVAKHAQVIHTFSGWDDAKVVDPQKFKTLEVS